jgi:predicted phosphoserine aminotransferase
MMGHRGPEIRGLMEELQVGLRALFRTESPVFVSTSSATGLMEAAIRNGVSGRVLCLVNGAFSQRFANIAEACGKKVDVERVPWGDRHDPAVLERRVARGRYDAVTVVHSETSTGVLQPLEELARVVGQHPNTLLLVDSVTGLGGAPVETDRWALDFVLTGSQKALALPPGLAFAVASSAMLERASTVPDRGLYFDLLAFVGNLEKLQTPNTPALSLLYALRAQLAWIEAEGVEERWERHARMARRCWSWVDALREERGVDVSVLAPEGSRSPTVTCITLPEGTSGTAVVATMKEKGWVIGAGYGKLKEEAIRIGHMGDHTEAELEELLEVLEEVIAP